MGETVTTRLGLVKPIRDTLTPVDIDRINLNMDRLDGFTGASNVADNTTPLTTDLYDGKIVREKTSGKVWVAELQANGSYAKKWLKYPYCFIAYSFVASTPANGVWNQYGWQTFSPSVSVNASAAEFGGASNNFWVVPFKGIYHLQVIDRFGSPVTANQFRASVFTFDGSMDTNSTEAQHHTQDTFFAYNHVCNITRLFPQGQVVGHNVYIQAVGSGPSLTTTLEATCIERLD